MIRDSLHAHWIAASGAEGHEGDPAARFPWWSFTKTVLAIAALKLVEDGALALDTPLPGQRFTLRQLLGHTAGLPCYTQLPAYHAAVAAGDPPWTRSGMLERATELRPCVAPGAGWAYSNIGYMLVGEQVAQATGQPLAEALSTLVLPPLGLREVRLAQARAEFAALHWPEAAGYDPAWVYHGCLTGTARDAARLLHALCTGAILRPATRAAMTSAHPLGGALPGRPWHTHGYGLGLMIGRTAAGLTLGHSGGGPFSVTAVYHFPDAPDPVTLACFARGRDEGRPETAAVGRALALSGR